MTDLYESYQAKDYFDMSEVLYGLDHPAKAKEWREAGLELPSEHISIELENRFSEYTPTGITSENVDMISAVYRGISRTNRPAKGDDGADGLVCDSALAVVKRKMAVKSGLIDRDSIAIDRISNSVGVDKVSEPIFRESLNPVVKALSQAVDYAGVVRQGHEVTNRGLLERYGFLDTETYQNYAGDYEKTIELLHLLGGSALKYFDKLNAQLSGDIAGDDSLIARPDFVHKIGFELGGVRQAGDWESAFLVDKLARSIPDRLQNDSTTDNLGVLIVHEGINNRKIAYRYQPMPSIDGHGFGLIRRRRALGDFYLTGFSDRIAVQLFKESLGMLILDEVRPNDRLLILDNSNLSKTIDTGHKDSDGQPEKKEVHLNSFSKYGENNTRAALIAGEEYFQPLTKEDAFESRKEAKTLLPVSTHIVAVVRDPRHLAK